VGATRYREKASRQIRRQSVKLITWGRKKKNNPLTDEEKGVWRAKGRLAWRRGIGVRNKSDPATVRGGPDAEIEKRGVL